MKERKVTKCEECPLRENKIEIKLEEQKKDTYKIYAYGREHGDVLEYEFDNLEDALDEMRKEWGGHPRRIEMPDGSAYEDYNDEEWKQRVIYKYVVLTDGVRSAPQNYLLKRLEKYEDLKRMLYELRRPRDISSLVDGEIMLTDVHERSRSKEENDKRMDVLLMLTHYDLIEFVDFYEGSGILDPKWKK